MNKPTMSDLGQVLFAAAVAQMRADALRLSAKKMAREVCNCAAYGFPHREGGGKCGEERDEIDDGVDLVAHDRMTSILMDAESAAEINRGRI